MLLGTHEDESLIAHNGSAISCECLDPSDSSPTLYELYAMSMIAIARPTKNLLTKRTDQHFMCKDLGQF